MATAQQKARAEETTRAANQIISAEAAAREKKTAMLKAARLASTRQASSQS